MVEENHDTDSEARDGHLTSRGANASSMLIFGHLKVYTAWTFALLPTLEIGLYLPSIGTSVQRTDELFRTFLGDGYTSVRGPPSCVRQEHSRR